MKEDLSDRAYSKKKAAAWVAMTVFAITSGVIDYAVQMYEWSWPWFDLAVRLPLLFLVGFSIASWCFFDGRQRAIEVSPFRFIAMGVIGILSVPHYLWLRSERRLSRFARTGFGFGFFAYVYAMHLAGLYGYYGALVLYDRV